MTIPFLLISYSFCDWLSIEILDLSKNWFSGDLPKLRDSTQLRKCHELIHINLQSKNCYLISPFCLVCV